MTKHDRGRVLDYFFDTVFLATPLAVLLIASRVNTNRDPSDFVDKSILRSQAEYLMSALPSDVRWPVYLFMDQHVFDNKALTESLDEVLHPTDAIMSSAGYGNSRNGLPPTYGYSGGSKTINGEHVFTQEACRLTVEGLPEQPFTPLFRVETFFDRDPSAFEPAHVYRIRATNLETDRIVLDRDVEDVQKELKEIVDVMEESGD